MIANMKVNASIGTIQSVTMNKPMLSTMIPKLSHIQPNNRLDTWTKEITSISKTK